MMTLWATWCASAIVRMSSLLGTISAGPNLAHWCGLWRFLAAAQGT